MQPGAPLTIPLEASRRLLSIQIVAHLVAAASVLASAVPGWLAAVLLAAVGYSLARFRNAKLPARLVLHDEGRLETVDAGGMATGAVVHPHSVVLASLIVLLYRQEGRTRALVLAGDSIAREDSRELRLWLRWRGQAVPHA